MITEAVEQGNGAAGSPAGAGRMRSIGRPIAVELARAGCDIVLTGTGRAPSATPTTRRPPAGATSSRWPTRSGAGPPGAALVSDVGDAARSTRCARPGRAELGRVDIVVNNAGAARGEDRVPVVELELDVWRTRDRREPARRASSCAAPSPSVLTPGRGGSIVNISSVAGKLCRPTPPPTPRRRRASRPSPRHGRRSWPAGMRVNAVCPGIIDTVRMDDIGRGERWDGWSSTQIPLRPGRHRRGHRQHGRVPVQRPGRVGHRPG